MEKNNVKTSYSRVTFLVALLLSNIGVLGIVSAFFLTDYKVVQLCVLLVSAVWIIVCEFVAIREIMSYEEIKGDNITISRVFKLVNTETKNIIKIVISDRVVYLINYTGKKLCSLDPTKPNTMKFVDALVERGIPKEIK